MARPRCDIFDASAIRAAIDRGVTTERAAYLAYAATAGRPYARSTFSLMLRRDPSQASPAPGPDPGSDPGMVQSPAGDAVRANEPFDRWLRASPVKPRILSLSAGGGLRVLAGSLIVFDDATTLTYSKSAKPRWRLCSRRSGVLSQWKPFAFAHAPTSRLSRSIEPMASSR
jgi:hypothetical protein